jgi:hypothetical protein
MRRNDRDSLTAYIELHERTWGMKQYTGRPKLDAILKAPVVVFWRANDGKDERWTITLHENLLDLEKYFTRMLFRSNVEPPKRRVVKIFKEGKAVIVRSVKILFQEIESS